MSLRLPVRVSRRVCHIQRVRISMFNMYIYFDVFQVSDDLCVSSF